MASFFDRVKHRKLVQWAVAYLAGAWLVLQVLDVIEGPLRISEELQLAVLVVLAIGFLIALVLAWYHGERGRQRLSGVELVIIAGLLALMGTGLRALDLGRTGPDGSTDPNLSEDGSRIFASDAPSVAVLPFNNLEDGTDDYFSDGLAEELLSRLGSTPGIRVASRTSSFTFRDPAVDVRQIGRALGVRAVVEGSVRRSADRLRITVALIDTESGFEIWSGRYDRELRDVFDVQDEIAGSVVAELAGVFELQGEVAESGLSQLAQSVGPSPGTPRRSLTEDLEAFDLYLLGRHRWATRLPDELRDAIGLFEQAIARDSSFALAYSGLADAIDALAAGDPAGLPLLERARWAARRGVELGPELAETHVSVGMLALDFEMDWTTGERELRRALEINPSYRPAYDPLADLLRVTGRFQEGMVKTEIPIQLDPLSATAHAWWGEALTQAGRYEEALSALRRAIELDAGYVRPDYLLATRGAFLGLSTEERGRHLGRWASVRVPQLPVDLVKDALDDPSLRDDASTAVSSLHPVPRAELLLMIGAHDEALQTLQRAFEGPVPTLFWIWAGVDPLYDPLRSDATFAELLAERGLTNGRTG
jgi:TolB-like protein/tetratricopeptide (TPR) repeat protein